MDRMLNNRVICFVTWIDYQEMNTMITWMPDEWEGYHRTTL